MQHLRAVDMLSTFARYTLLRITRYFERERTAKVITILGFIAVFAVFITTTYYGFRTAFRFISRDEFFGDALFLYIVEFFMAISFVCVVASALISGAFSLFRNSDDTLLMASPRYGAKPFLVFSKMFFSSLWPFLAFVIPALFAIEHVYGLSLGGFALAIGAIVLLIALGVLVAGVTLFMTALALRWLECVSRIPMSMRNLLALNALVFAGAFAALWQHIATIDLFQVFRVRALDASVADVSSVITLFSWLPTHHATMVVYYARTDLFADVFRPCAILIVIVALTALLGYFLARTFHLSLWQRFQEHTRNGARTGHHSPLFGAAALAHVRDARDAMVTREGLSFVRNARGLLWLGFVSFIWFIAVGSSKAFSRSLGAERVSGDAIPAVITAFQFAVIIYFVSIFVLRFAFPSFSSERRTFWVFGTAPVDLAMVFRSKLRFFLTVFGICAVIFTLVSAAFTSVSPEDTLLALGVVFLATITLTILGLSMGAIYPNRDSDDPEIVSTSLAGFGFMFGAILCGSLGAYALHEYAQHARMIPLLFLIAVCALVAPLFFRRAQASLREREY